jgi:tetratricopeptide (TPR) repeat protein
VLARIENIPFFVPFIAAPLGWAYALAGRIDGGVTLIEQAIEQAGSMQLVAHQALRLTWLAQAHLLGGRRETALGRARRALHLAEDRQERGQQAYVRRLLADIDAEAERPDVAAAAAAYRGALDLAAMLQMRPLAAQCLLGLGRLHRRTGQREQAGRELADAMAQFSAMGMTLWVERAQAALDE